MLRFYSTLFVLAVVGAIDSDPVVITTTSGTVRGRKVDTADGEVYQYLGIPYAQAPIGKLRFRPPKELVSTNSQRFDATRFGPACYQPPHLTEVISPLLRTKGITIDEDCLNLNVYVPKIADGSGELPVMIWLPGEGFDYADARQFEGTYLASLGKVILVTVNYRVSVFGFLASETEDAPGNVGLLDQRMAFRWVAKNIEKFGGNPKNVTLFGTFTGAMSISMHMTSNYALNHEERLFDRVILQSGIAVGSWVFDRNPSLTFQHLAELTKCSRISESETLECLRKLPAEVLLKYSLQVPQRWRPIIDGTFITREPLEAVKMGKHAEVDVILGNNEHEGSLCLLTLYAQKSEMYKKVLKGEISNEEFEQLIEDNLLQYFGKEDNLTTKVIVQNYKYQQSSLSRSFIDFCGDLFITSKIDQFARLLTTNKKGKVYRYLFSHRPSFSRQAKFLSAVHGDDVLFSLGLVYQLEGNYHEKLLSRKMIVLFTNFARYGKPDQFQHSSTTIWPEFTSRDKQILRFSSLDTDVVDGSLYDKSSDLWFRLVPSLTLTTDENIHFSNNVYSSRLTAPERKQNMYLIDKLITDEAAEYVLIGLMCFTIILLIVISAILVSYVATKTKLYAKLNENVS